MPKISYVPKRFNAEHRAIIDRANQIITDYSARGFALSLRQIFYQFVSRTWIDNTQKSYKRLGSILSEARRAGEVDWDAIEDRTRSYERMSTWSTPGDIIESAAESYRVDLWRDQPCFVNCFVEKQAIEGIVEQACRPRRVPYFACRGYVSDSSIWEAGRRLLEQHELGKEAVVLHLGDHDPSGIDMTRDIRDRLALFSGLTLGEISVRRLALNRDQIDRYSPPPNPAKASDSRFEGYERDHGNESWELDALDPDVIVELIRDEIESLIDEEAWDVAIEHERSERDLLRRASRRWEDVEELLRAAD